MAATAKTSNRKPAASRTSAAVPAVLATAAEGSQDIGQGDGPVDVERVAAELMVDGAGEHIEAAREEFGPQLGGRDYLYVEICVPDATEGLGRQYEAVFQRTVIAPRGALEGAVLGIAALCDRLDPGGRDVTGKSTSPAASSASKSTRAEDASGREVAQPLESLQRPNGSKCASASAPDEAEAPEDEADEGLAIRPLGDLMEDVPLDPDAFAEFAVVPKVEDVVRGLQLQIRTIGLRLGDVGRFVREVRVCEEPAPDSDFVFKAAAERDLAQAVELLDELGTELYAYLEHAGFGRLVELADQDVDAVRELGRAAPWHHRRPAWLVSAAVRHLARLPRRGGVLAVAEQNRLLALGRKCFAGWPWTDQSNRRITAESEYAPPSGDAAPGGAGAAAAGATCG